MQHRFAAHIALIIVNLIYGVNFLVAKEVMPAYIGPSGFIFIRVSATLVLFLLLYAGVLREKIDWKSDWKRFVLCGITGVTVNQLLFYEGLNYTTPINAALIFTSNPILTLIVSALILKERITPIKIVGILLGFGGAITLILFSRGGFDLRSETSLGNLLVLINALSYAFYLVLVKPLMKKYKPLTVITFNFFMGMIFVAPFGWPQFSVIAWETFTPFIWGCVLFTVLGTTFITYLFSVFALKTLNPSSVSIYVYIQPVTAAVTALILGKDQLSLELVICTLMIFSGVYLVIRD